MKIHAAKIFAAVCTLSTLTGCPDAVPVASTETRLEAELVRTEQDSSKPYSSVSIYREHIEAVDARAGEQGRTVIREIEVCLPAATDCKNTLTTSWKKYSCDMEFGYHYDFMAGKYRFGPHMSCKTREHDRVVMPLGSEIAEDLLTKWRKADAAAKSEMNDCLVKYGQTPEQQKTFVCTYR